MTVLIVGAGVPAHHKVSTSERGHSEVPAAKQNFWKGGDLSRAYMHIYVHKMCNYTSDKLVQTSSKNFPEKSELFWKGKMWRCTFQRLDWASIEILETFFNQTGNVFEKMEWGKPDYRMLFVQPCSQAHSWWYWWWWWWWFLQVAMYANVFLAMANFVKSRGIIHHNFHESEIVDIPKCYYTRWGTILS